jgi:hypothetical protein
MVSLFVGATATVAGDCNGNGAIASGQQATGQEQWQLQWGQRRSIVPIAIDDHHGSWGASVGNFYSVIYSKKLVNGKKRCKKTSDILV